MPINIDKNSSYCIISWDLSHKVFDWPVCPSLHDELEPSTPLTNGAVSKTPIRVGPLSIMIACLGCLTEVSRRPATIRHRPTVETYGYGNSNRIINRIWVRTVWCYMSDSMNIIIGPFLSHHVCKRTFCRPCTVLQLLCKAYDRLFWHKGLPVRGAWES